MTDLTDLSTAELQGQHAAILPEREALALLNIASPVGVNLSIAVNAASIGSAATALAGQGIGIVQS
jgi:hypothetical protein